MSPKKVSKSAKPTSVKAPVVKKKSTKAKYVVSSSESETDSGSDSSSESESETEEELPPPPVVKKSKTKVKKLVEPEPVVEVDPISSQMKELIATLRDISVSLDIVAKHVSEVPQPVPQPVVQPVPQPVPQPDVLAELDRILSATNKTIIIASKESTTEELRLNDADKYGTFHDLISQNVVEEDVVDTNNVD
jgi:hypothetical protein